jgi:tRNA nucleotidyltransferase (CCA-adding enzyme)
MKLTPSRDPLVRLAALLHDIGKPYSAGKDEHGLITFHNHESIGAKLVTDIADRLRLSKKQKEKLQTLVRWHMFTVDEHITDSAIRRFIRRVGLENVKDVIDLRIGDRLGSGLERAESWRLKKFKERIEKELHPPFSINDMVIDGNDVMKELNIKPGPIVGKILNRLFEEVDEDLSRNNKEYLLKRIHEIDDEIKKQE